MVLWGETLAELLGGASGSYVICQSKKGISAALQPHTFYGILLLHDEFNPFFKSDVRTFVFDAAKLCSHSEITDLSLCPSQSDERVQAEFDFMLHSSAQNIAEPSVKMLGSGRLEEGTKTGWEDRH